MNEAHRSSSGSSEEPNRGPLETRQPPGQPPANPQPIAPQAAGAPGTPAIGASRPHSAVDFPERGLDPERLAWLLDQRNARARCVAAVEAGIRGSLGEERGSGEALDPLVLAAEVVRHLEGHGWVVFHLDDPIPEMPTFREAMRALARPLLVWEDVTEIARASGGGRA